MNPFAYGKAVGLLDAMSRSGYVHEASGIVLGLRSRAPEVAFVSVDFILCRVLTPERFGLKEYNLADFEACLKDLEEGKVTKAVFAVCPQLE